MRGRATTSALLFILLCLLCVGCTGSEEQQFDPQKAQALHTLRALRAGAQKSGVAGINCEPGTRPGKVGATDGETTAKGITYNVRTPDDYDPLLSYPLLMVYAPAGTSATRSERFTDLTPYATAAGFIVAYANARRMSIPTITELSTIPGLIAKQWCIDEKRVYLTGHSDGGTVSLALALLEQTRGLPTAVAPSAAGMRGADLTAFSCPAPLPVMILHSADDRHFPGFGVEIAAWWAGCNKCDPRPGSPMENGCVAYPHCADAVATWYCEGKGSHSVWSSLNMEIMKFFSTAGATAAPSPSSRQSEEARPQGEPSPPGQ